jgi:hypothetical protein
MLQVAGRRKSKVTTSYLWNAINTGLMKLEDLGSPSAAVTFWDLKDPSGRWIYISYNRFWRSASYHSLYHNLAPTPNRMLF